MINSKPKKKVKKRKNPINESDLNSLLGELVRVISKYSTFLGRIQMSDETLYELSVIKDRNIQAYINFGLEDIKKIKNKTIYLIDISERY